MSNEQETHKQCVQNKINKSIEEIDESKPASQPKVENYTCFKTSKSLLLSQRPSLVKKRFFLTVKKDLQGQF